MLRTDDFNYDLPEELIASHPSDKRENSRLLILHKDSGELEHRHFYDIIEYLLPGDLLVLNDTKVLPARLTGKKKGIGDGVRGTGGKAELLLLKEREKNLWECMVNPSGRLKPGARVDLGKCEAEIVEWIEGPLKTVRFISERDIKDIAHEIGRLPLPPYISKQLSEKERTDPELLSRYQTVYASKEGASAAPTAGLHFTPDLLTKAKEKGIEIAHVTLHTGVGTFKPVTAEFVEQHKMFKEQYEISGDAAEKINRIKSVVAPQCDARTQNAPDRRIIAVGTTTVRTLEDCFKKHGKIVACREEADIFIYPPYKFNVVDAMITNFHFPKSTLLMMVSAFAGKENIFKAYKEAVKQSYRFYSFGDAMMIV